MPKAPVSANWWLMLEKYVRHNPERPGENIRWPALGLYNASNPEVLDWQNKWALEHGISLWVFDWYWEKEQGPKWNHSLEAFLDSEYEGQINFAVMLCGGKMGGWGGNPEEVREELLKMADVWIENYFTRPNYFKIGGKPVVVFLALTNLVNGLGGWDQLESVLEEIQTKVGAAGFDYGAYFIGNWDLCRQSNDREQCFRDSFVRYRQTGFDAVTAYGCNGGLNLRTNVGLPGGESYSLFADNCTDNLKFYTDALVASGTSLKFLPTFTSNFDKRPVRLPNEVFWTSGANLADFQRILNAVKELADDPAKSPVLVKKAEKVVLIAHAWNEWQEGSEFEPGMTEGGTEGPFSYLNRLRQTFFPDVTPPDDVLPEDVGLGPYDVEPRGVTSGWDFNDESGLREWWPLFSATDPRIVDGGATSHINRLFGMVAGVKLPAVDFEKVVIRLRLFSCPTGECGGKLHFVWKSSEYPWGEPYQGAYPALELSTDQQFHTYEFSLSDRPKWQGEIQQLLVAVYPDENSLPARVTIDFIRLEPRPVEFSLSPGWTEIIWPASLGDYTAQTALEDINTDCGAGTALAISWKRENFWQEYVAGRTLGEDFGLSAEGGYYVKVGKECSWGP